ncbi:hypothetical protein Ocin01_03908 [Orchesella cincta]|uniref:Uncharacterized protein n=1 Tax=Orchesella cincta TaxID=48709 RepID=A0A1D2NBW6_ORCCI|nr:hypothetical protein Ocin01_03908 [Orchesella cincta]
MNKLTVYLLFCLLVVQQASVVQPRTRFRHQRSKRQLNSQQMEYDRNKNLVNSAAWTCSVPKPRLVYLEEATNNPIQMPIPPDTRLFVDATVLHRCEPAFGCCTYPLKCGPSTTAPVNVTFKTLHVHTGSETYHTVSFLNHTLCHCQNRS